jgi:hypothetical protein
MTLISAPNAEGTPSRPLWGIGQYLDERGERLAWEISEPEIHRDLAWATQILGRLGVGTGGRVLICSMLSEAGHFYPFTIGPMMLGAQVSLCDATAAEAVRLRMFSGLLRYHAVIGVTGDLLDGLEDLDADPAVVFAHVPVIGARPDAYARLVAAGLSPHHFVLVGPAVAVGLEPGAPAEVAADEWSLGEHDGRITVTARAQRAMRFDATPTALRGRLVDPTHLIPETDVKKAHGTP